MTAHVVSTFAVCEARALSRSKLLPVYMVLIPGALALILGPAVTGLSGSQAHARATIGFSVMFAFMTVNYSGRALFREHASHTWRRNAIIRPSNAAYLMGKSVAIVVVGCIQLTTFVLLALLVMDLRLEGGLITGSGQLMIVLGLHSVCGAAIGTLLFTLVHSYEAFVSITYLMLITFATTGGCIVASGMLPDWSRTIGLVSPHHWAMRAVDEITSGAGRWSVVLQSASMLVVIAVLAAVVSWYRFDYSTERIAEL